MFHIENYKLAYYYIFKIYMSMIIHQTELSFQCM